MEEIDIFPAKAPCNFCGIGVLFTMQPKPTVSSFKLKMKSADFVVRSLNADRMDIVCSGRQNAVGLFRVRKRVFEQDYVCCARS